MVNDLQEKFFCPRLIDYIVVVGSFSPLLKHPPSDVRSSKNGPDGGNANRDGSAQFNRSSSVTSPNPRPSRPDSISKKTSLYSVGRALTCSSFSISSSSVSHIQVSRSSDVGGLDLNTLI